MSLEFFIDIKSFRSHYGPGVDSASNINEYQENFLGVNAGRERSVQGAGGETRGEETAGETKA